MVTNNNKKPAAFTRPRPTNPIDGDDGLAIIGAGFGRTGTSSLQEALEILGYGPCYHMREVFKDPDGIHKWNTIITATAEKSENKNDPDWDNVFFGYKSCVDLPASTFYRELMEQYPKAKVILTVRDSESWWTSVSETISPPPPIWAFVYSITGMSNPEWQKLSANAVWIPFCGSVRNARNKQAMITAFEKHNKAVQQTVPKNKLLVFQVKDGWKDLCEFLQVPVPDVPFPKAWNTEEFKAMIHTRKRKALKRLAGGFAALLFVGAAASLGIGKLRSNRAK